MSFFGNAKSIKTSRVQLLTRLDRLAVLIPIVVFLLSLLDPSMRMAFGVILSEDVDLLTKLPALCTLPAASLFISLPILFIYRAVSASLKKSAIQNASFQVSADLDYFRDKLSGLSPATISLLMDLQIEPNKDLAALILRFTMLGLVTTQDGEVRVVSQSHPSLSQSDRFILAAFARGGISAEDVRQWSAMAQAQAVEEGYLTRTAIGCVVGFGAGCIGFVLRFAGALAVLFLLAFVLAPLMPLAEQYALAMDGLDIPEIFQYVARTPQLGMLALGAMAVLMIFCYLIYLPLVTVFRMLSSTSQTRLFVRTQKGNIAAEQIAGMKNFLHDFSIISQAEKEHLLLWDDFLIYAVVLEENRQIVDEILRMKNMRYHTVTIRPDTHFN